VLKGRERREVMSISRNRRFFLEVESWSSRSDSGRVRLRDRVHRCFPDLVNERGRSGKGPAAKVKTEMSEVAGVLKGWSNIFANEMALLPVHDGNIGTDRWRERSEAGEMWELWVPQELVFEAAGFRTGLDGELLRGCMQSWHNRFQQYWSRTEGRMR